MTLSNFSYSVIYVVFLVLAVHPASAEIYRWVDQDGNVHFSDEKPANAKTDIVKPAIADPPPEPDEGEIRRREYLEGAALERKLPPTQSNTSQFRGQVNAAQCRLARVEYGILEEPVPAYRTEAGELRAHWVNDTHRGSREYVPDEERDAELDAAWGRMNQYCDNASDHGAYIDAWNDYVDDVYCTESQVRLEHARKSRARTPKSVLENMEEEFYEKCVG